MAWEEKIREWAERMRQKPDLVDSLRRRIALLSGLLLLILGGYMGAGPARLLIFGSRSPGRVVGFAEKNWNSFDGSGPAVSHSTFLPVVEFSAAEKTVRFTDWRGSSNAGGLGATVLVLFDAGHPERAMIDQAALNWNPWAPISLVGFLLFYVGLPLRRE
jgi:hypothetical protein